MNSLQPPIGPIRGATVTTPDLDASVRAYVDGFGWRVSDEINTPLAVSGRLLGTRRATVTPPPGAASIGGVELVEVPGSTPLEPLHTYGWSALEVSVLDVTASTRRAEAAGWRVLFEPVVLGGGKFPLVAAQLCGPSGEGFYITEIRGEMEGFELPTPAVDVDGIFIAVLGSSNLEQARGIIESRFDVRRASDRELPVRVVNAQFGFPSDRLHRISSVQLRGRTCIEVDQLPTEATARDQSTQAGILALAVEADVAEPEWVDLGDGALLRLTPPNGG